MVCAMEQDLSAGEAGLSCVAGAVVTLLHLLLGIFTVLGAFLLPKPWLLWHLCCIPLAMLLFIVVGGCPVSMLEYHLHERCASCFPQTTVVPPVPLLPHEPGARRPTFADQFRKNIIRRVVFAATDYRMNANEVRAAMFMAWFVVYVVVMFRLGQIGRLYTAAAHLATMQ